MKSHSERLLKCMYVYLIFEKLLRSQLVFDCVLGVDKCNVALKTFEYLGLETFDYKNSRNTALGNSSPCKIILAILLSNI